MLKDPITKEYTGQALVQMRSAEHAGWVNDDLNHMIFSMGYGPRPLEASVARPGKPLLSIMHCVYMACY